MYETEHLFTTKANTNRLKQSIKQIDMQNKPLKITLKFYNKKISICFIDCFNLFVFACVDSKCSVSFIVFIF